MNKTVRIGALKQEYTQSTIDVFCKIEIEKGVLSISGVEGPRHNGDCYGSAGQLVMHLTEDSIETFAPGWDREVFNIFLSIWHEWHLNDMQAGCVHQRVNKWVDVRISPDELPDNKTSNRDSRGILAIWVYPKEHPKGLLTKPCEVCGYKYGSKWLKEELPTSVIQFLVSLPDSDKIPAWV